MDNVVENEDTFSTSVLPLEILSQIFTFLPLVDRKAVRLTCRSWYGCCACVKITEHEKFVFRTDPGVEHIADVMLRSTYSLLNLEFQGLPVGRMLPANVWEACGLRIRELEFYMCQWDDETISNIILHCENLTTLVITEDEDFYQDDDDNDDLYEDDDDNDVLYEDDDDDSDDHAIFRRIPIAYSLGLLNDFIMKGIRRPKLHTLSIYIKYDDYESVLRKIFLLHPCIQHFTFKLFSGGSSEFLDPFAMRLDKCLNPDTRLESLTSLIVTSEGAGSYLGMLVDKTEPGLRLKYLETCFTYYSEIINNPNVENKIFNFFRWQKNLEVIKLTITVDTSSEIENLFYNILNSCLELREFQLDTNRSPMELKPSELSRFIASISQLKSLGLCFQLEDSKQVPSFSDLIPDTVQLKLTLLDWIYLGEDSDFYAAFLQRCPSLKHLHLHSCWDSTLQTIFKYLVSELPDEPELQTLVLDDAGYITEIGFTGGNEDGYSIRRLQQLKHLALRPGESEYCLSEKTMLELQLPRLEFLSLNVGWYKRLSKEALNRFASHVPALRVLAIEDYRSSDFEDTIRLCTQLNNLHRLILHTHSSRWKEVVESIFSACPSLRYISEDYIETITRDPFTENVLFKLKLKFPGSIFNSFIC